MASVTLEITPNWQVFGPLGLPGFRIFDSRGLGTVDFASGLLDDNITLPRRLTAIAVFANRFGDLSFASALRQVSDLSQAWEQLGSVTFAYSDAEFKFTAQTDYVPDPFSGYQFGGKARTRITALYNKIRDNRTTPFRLTLDDNRPYKYRQQILPITGEWRLSVQQLTGVVEVQTTRRIDTSAARAVVATRERELASAQRRLRAAEAAVTTQKAEVATVQARVTTARNAVSSLNARITELEATIARLRMGTTSAPNVDRELAAVEAAEDDVEAKQREVRRLGNVVAAATRDVTARQGDVQDAIDELSRLGDEAEFELSRRQWVSSLAEWRRERTLADAEYNDAVSDLTNARRATGVPRAEIRRIEQRVQLASRRLIIADTRIREHEQEIARIDLVLNRLTTLGPAARRNLTRARGELTASQARLATAQNQLAAARRALTTAQTTLTNARAALTRALSGSGVTVDQRALGQAQADLRLARQQLTAAQARLSTAQSDLSKAQGELSPLEDAVTTAQAAVSDAEAALETARDNVRDGTETVIVQRREPTASIRSWNITTDVNVDIGVNYRNKIELGVRQIRTGSGRTRSIDYNVQTDLPFRNFINLLNPRFLIDGEPYDFTALSILTVWNAIDAVRTLRFGTFYSQYDTSLLISYGIPPTNFRHAAAQIDRVFIGDQRVDRLYYGEVRRF